MQISKTPDVLAPAARGCRHQHIAMGVMLVALLTRRWRLCQQLSSLLSVARQVFYAVATWACSANALVASHEVGLVRSVVHIVAVVVRTVEQSPSRCSPTECMLDLVHSCLIV